MTFVEWNRDLSVGVDELDKQHQKLFALTNDLYENQGDAEQVREVFNGLMEYTRIHFTTEEDYFAKCGYDGAEAHIAEHLKFIEELLDLKDRFERGEEVIPKLLKFLKGWWEHHLKVIDHKYVENFKACGLK